MKDNIVYLFTPEQIGRDQAAERERVLGEVKYQRCLGVLRRLLEAKKLAPEEFARAESRLAQRYCPQAVRL